MTSKSRGNFWAFFTLSYKMKQTIEISMVCDRSIICKNLQHSPINSPPILYAASKMHQNAVFKAVVGGFIHEIPFYGSSQAADEAWWARRFECDFQCLCKNVLQTRTKLTFGAQKSTWIDLQIQSDQAEWISIICMHGRKVLEFQRLHATFILESLPTSQLTNSIVCPKTPSLRPQGYIFA